MREHLANAIERRRITDGPMASASSDGAYGAFMFDNGMAIVASGGDADDKISEGWEHVSVSFADRCPTWEEMCWVKDQFWGPDACVFQFHPPRIKYINKHPFCLHLWRNKLFEPALPPGWMIG